MYPINEQLNVSSKMKSNKNEIFGLYCLHLYYFVAVPQNKSGSAFLPNWKQLTHINAKLQLPCILFMGITVYFKSVIFYYWGTFMHYTISNKNVCNKAMTSAFCKN